MNLTRINPVRAGVIGGALVLAAVGLWFLLDPAPQVGLSGERDVVELDVRSKFSRIKVTREKKVRTLWFVRDNGDEVIESMLDLDRPYDLIVSYTRYMFLSYIFNPQPKKVLIVGLGGGSMVHFLKHYDPNVKVDVVEIDPKIVEIADKFFGAKSGGNINIINQDAFEFLKNTQSEYDVIYMDAFLKPSDATDTTGVPLNLKTVMFYKDVQKKLKANGLVAFNMNPHDKIENDIKNVRDAFGQTYVYELPNYGGNVVIGTMARNRLRLQEMQTEARALNQRFQTSYSYVSMVNQLRRP